MLTWLKTIWLRIVNPKFAKSLEFRIRTLEAQAKATNETVLALLKRFPLADIPEEGKQVEVRVRPSHPWPQRRAWLESTDGGRRLEKKEKCVT